MMRKLQILGRQFVEVRCRSIAAMKTHIGPSQIIGNDENEIWFATLGGVSKCVLNDSLFGSDISFVSFSEQHGLGNNFIYKVLVDSRQRVWFATDGNGITLYKDGKFTNYSEKEGL